MKKPKKLLISDVLHYAADHCLLSEGTHKGHKNKFTCSAVMDAYFLHCEGTVKSFILNDILEGLTNMGCNRRSPYLFKHYGDPTYFDATIEEVQGMRYMWLKWAALMAEEQGV